MAQIEIDGKQITVADGGTLIDAAEAAGIYIPRFCYHKKLSVAANCRMCLVEVEKAPKPVPACATPVTDGMKVFTHSGKAVQAQKDVMEFLLVNHPLDCPVCDQGGECQLQDLSVGYGGVKSRYQEEKRAVTNKDFGPLIGGDMTRCIHCTRCVRFTQEIAGRQEFGQIQRGEHSEIVTFVSRAVESELSGNVIDLCPVGALTSKPFRFKARSWELTRRPSVSPHDGLGANLSLHLMGGKVLRAVPRENDAINECWLADRDRFSYEGLYAEDRLTTPMVKQGGKWRECEWHEALQYAIDGLKQVKEEFGADSIGALAGPHSTLEELYLLQKLVRAFGSDNVDFRLRQSDCSADAKRQGAPWLGMPVAELPQLNAALVVGSTLRADHPLLAHRLRQAVNRGGQLNVIHSADDDLRCRVANKLIVAPGALVDALAQVAKAAAEAKGVAAPAGTAGVTVSAAAKAMADSLLAGERKAVLLGNLAQHHPRAADLHALAQAIADITGASFGFLGEGANSVGGYLAGAVPKTGLSAAKMLEQPRKAYLLMGLEPELDTYNPQQALAALSGAFVVAMSSYKGRLEGCADVLLPIAPFAETSGTYVNTQGDVQSFAAASGPVGETRPAWKVLRVLGNLLDLPGFDQDSSEAVRDEALDGVNVAQRLNNRLSDSAVRDVAVAAGLHRVGEVPIYQADALVRRAPALQKTVLAAAPVAWLAGALMDKMGFGEGEKVILRQGAWEASMVAARDDRLPRDAVRVAAAHPATAALGGMLEPIQVEKAS